MNPYIELDIKYQLCKVQQELNALLSIIENCFEQKEWKRIKTNGQKMDKQIRKVEKTIKKDTKKEEKELKHLEKADKKRDKVCALGKKMMKKKKK